MSDALERAAVSLAAEYIASRPITETLHAYDHMDRTRATKLARSALLAFLDGEDAVNAMTGAANGGLPDSDYGDDVRAMLAALRALITKEGSGMSDDLVKRLRGEDFTREGFALELFMVWADHLTESEACERWAAMSLADQAEWVRRAGPAWEMYCVQSAAISSLERELAEARKALEPFAALTTVEGRRPCKLDGVDPSTTEGRPVDDSSDDARVALLVRVGDLRAAARVHRNLSTNANEGGSD